jgi:hypothetical protein
MTLEEASKVKNTEIAKELVRAYICPPAPRLLTRLVLATRQAALQHARRRCDQVSHQQLLQEEPQREAYQPRRQGAKTRGHGRMSFARENC